MIEEIIDDLRKKIRSAADVDPAPRALEKRRDIGALEVAREHSISESVSEIGLRPTDEMFGYSVEGYSFHGLLERYSSEELEQLRRQKQEELESVIEKVDLGSGSLSRDQRANLRLAQGELERGVGIPEQVSEIVEGRNGLRSKWGEAEEFSEVEEDFAEMIAAFRDYSDQDYGEIIAIWEPNVDRAKVDSIVQELKQEAVSILEEVELEDTDRVWSRVEEEIDTGRELKSITQNPTGMHEYLANYMLGGNPVKMPVRIGGSGMEYGNAVMAPLQTVDDRYWAKCFDTTAHEFGHTFGRQNLSTDHKFLPLGEPPSEAVDEATARFYQGQVFRSGAFLREFFVPAVNDWFTEEGEEFNPEAIHLYFKAIEPDNRERVSADPVTYPIHVAVRYELEKELIESDEPVEKIVQELDRKWRSKMQEYLGDPLGIEIEEMPDSETVLQDVHWGKGKLGYFPTYVLGDVIAANWRQDIEDDLEHGFSSYLSGADLEPINEWVVENIWRHGKAVWERSDAIDLDTAAYREQMREVAELYD